MIIDFHRGIWRTENSFIGLIYPPGIEPLFVLELPWRNNQKRVSCIPAGIYTCRREPSSKNKDWKEAFFVLDVPGRSDIICGHIANKPEELLGCMAFGMYYDSYDHIAKSTDAIYKWRDAMKEYNEFELRIL